MKSVVDYTNKLKSFFAQKQALSDEILYDANTGVRNLGRPILKEQQNQNVYFTPIANGGTNIHGTSSGQYAQNSTASYDTLFKLPAGTYILSMFGTNRNDIRIRVSNAIEGAGAIIYATAYKDEEVTFTLSQDTECRAFWILDTANVTVDEDVYFMIRPASISNNTFVPWAMTNSDLTKSVLHYKDVACAATTGNFATVSDSCITEDHVLIRCEFANTEAITAEPTWATSNGSLVLNGTCASATSATITLARKSN